mmetsp:Transcript_24237/g.55357  ORF Transcript_24237/g.55357 Transcript_24237/m.55357 type:complete len:217 (-) Transcript_24237:556-1206(-)
MARGSVVSAFPDLVQTDASAKRLRCHIGAQQRNLTGLRNHDTVNADFVLVGLNTAPLQQSSSSLSRSLKAVSGTSARHFVHHSLNLLLHRATQGRPGPPRPRPVRAPAAPWRRARMHSTGSLTRTRGLGHRRLNNRVRKHSSATPRTLLHGASAVPLRAVFPGLVWVVALRSGRGWGSTLNVGQGSIAEVASRIPPALGQPRAGGGRPGCGPKRGG